LHLNQVGQQERDVALVRLEVALEEGEEIWQLQPVGADEPREQVHHHHAHLEALRRLAHLCGKNAERIKDVSSG